MDKFPERYSFKLTDQEYKNLWSKCLNANISSKSRVIQEYLLNKEFICLLQF